MLPQELQNSVKDDIYPIRILSELMNNSYLKQQLQSVHIKLTLKFQRNLMMDKQFVLKLTSLIRLLNQVLSYIHLLVQKQIDCIQFYKRLNIMIEKDKASNILLQIQPVAIHTLHKGHKWLRHLGLLIIQQRQDESIWAVINHHTSYEIIRDTKVCRIVFNKYSSYLFEDFKGGFVAISAQTTLPKLLELQNAFKKRCEVIDISHALQNQPFKRKIDYHCPSIYKMSIHNDNIFTPLYKMAGKLQNYVFQRFGHTGCQDNCHQKQQELKADKNMASGSEIQKNRVGFYINTWAGYLKKVKDFNKKFQQKINSISSPIKQKPQKQKSSGKKSKGKKSSQVKKKQLELVSPPNKVEQDNNKNLSQQLIQKTSIQPEVDLKQQAEKVSEMISIAPPRLQNVIIAEGTLVQKQESIETEETQNKEEQDIANNEQGKKKKKKKNKH